MILLGGRICSCPEGMYYAEYVDNERGFLRKCAPFPGTLDSNAMKFELEYSYNGEEFVQLELVSE